MLSNKTTALDRIPNTSVNHCKNKVIRRIKKDGIVNYSIGLSGKEALGLTGQGLYLSSAVIKDFLYQNVANNISVNDRINSDIPSLTGRVVEPVSISLQYKDPYMFSQTNLGQAYKLYRLISYIEDILTIDSQSAAHDFFLNHPGTVETVTIFEDTMINNVEKLNLKTQTPYLTLERSGYHDRKDTVIKEKSIIHNT